MPTPEVAVVIQWHDALNAGDLDRLAALSSEDVEVAGPRGSGTGRQLLRAWFGRAGVRLEPRRIFARAGTVVAEERATWHAAEVGQPSGEHDVASVFVVRAGEIARVARHPDLAVALDAAGLSPSDEVRGG